VVLTQNFKAIAGLPGFHARFYGESENLVDQALNTVQFCGE
jgi:hypothetical protein